MKGGEVESPNFATDQFCLIYWISANKASLLLTSGYATLSLSIDIFGFMLFHFEVTYDQKEVYEVTLQKSTSYSVFIQKL